MNKQKLYNSIMEKVASELKQALNETSTGEFTGVKKKWFRETDEYKKYQEDHKQIAEYRKIAQWLFHEIDKFRPGQAADMWNLVYKNLGCRVGLGNIFGQRGRGSDAMTTLGKPANRAGWRYAPGWDGTAYISDMDSLSVYTSGFGWSAKSGNDEDLIKYGFEEIYSWLKTILYAVGDAENGYQDFDDNTFYNCKEGEKIREKFGMKI